MEKNNKEIQSKDKVPHAYKFTMKVLHLSLKSTLSLKKLNSGIIR